MAKAQTQKVETTAAMEIDQLVQKGLVALEALETFNQEQIDEIVHLMAITGMENHMELARLAVEETKRGVFEDKCIKNMFATESIWHTIKKDKTCGVIKEDEVKQLVEIASPVGVVCGITPVTNPTSTTLFKALIAIKTRNPIIFAFHPSAQECSAKAAQIVYEAALKAGAPENCIQWIAAPSMEKTNLIMNHPDVACVLATGGKGMVEAAYSTGKPALGVGPGNVPVYIHKTAKIKRAVNDLIVSKTFDNGMICASEQAIIVDDEIYDAVKKEFQRFKVYFATAEENAKLEDAMFNETKTGVKSIIPGMPAEKIAELAGIKVPVGTQLIIAEIPSAGPEYPLSREKLSPVLAMIRVKSVEEGFAQCENMLNLDGLGHSAVIHTRDEDLQIQFGLKMKACRILVNQPSSQGGIGDLYNNNIPSLTLGCGSYGHNSVSKNVSTIDLLNIKTLARRRNNMQWFKVPSKIYFEENSIRYLTEMLNVERVFIVADKGMAKLGYVTKVVEELEKRNNHVIYDVFTDVEPNPSTNTVYRGTQKIRDFQPDTIIAVGGGSPMDAAKVMWLFYEHPELNFFGAKQKFLDIRKRIYKLSSPKKTRMVCIPTTSGTGSEVTPFSVITDSETGVKYPLADYCLTPNVAIIDPQFVMSVPKDVTADTGMDVLTHAIESYVSTMATDYTRGLSLQAIKSVFDNLYDSYEYADHDARVKMHDASTMAGMAFANALLGISHSIAHKIGGKWGIIHGRANAILLPHVIRYNAQTPTKHALWAKYEYFRADEDYADIARYLGLPGSTTEELVESLIDAIVKLGQSVGIKMNLKANGVTRKVLDKDMQEMVYLAYEDQCTSTNPKEPLLTELQGILEASFDMYE